MLRNNLHLILLAVACVLVLTGGWVLYDMTLGRALLDGESRFDFGVVMMDGPEKTVSHTFELVNNTDENVMVLDIISSCKCTSSSMNDPLIRVGETLVITAEVKLDQSGLRESGITLVFNGNRIQQLNIKAVGKRTNPLSYIGAHIELLVGLPKILAIHCDMYSQTQEPPPLMTKVTKGVTATFKRWKIIGFYNEKWQNPAIWEAELVLTRNEMDLPEDRAVQVSIDGEKWLTVPINRPDLVKIFDYDTMISEEGRN